MEAAYADFLGRPPTAAERDAVVALLVGGASRRTVVAGLARSPEWTGRVVSDLYQSTLGRPGDAAGIAYWAGRIARGELSVAQVTARFYSSPEYVARIGAGDVGAWVDDLYTEILGRASDAPGRAFWVDQVAVRGRAGVALAFVQSRESARRRVDGLYRSLLGRAAEAAGLDFWAPRVVARGDIVLAVDLAASREYLTRAQTR